MGKSGSCGPFVTNDEYVRFSKKVKAKERSRLRILGLNSDEE